MGISLGISGRRKGGVRCKCTLMQMPTTQLGAYALHATALEKKRLIVVLEHLGCPKQYTQTLIVIEIKIAMLPRRTARS